MLFRSDPAVHALRQVFRNGQPQSGPSVVPGGRTMGLGEALEDFCQLLRRNSDSGVRNRKADHSRRGGARLLSDADNHGALVGKFQGVADQIDQNLVQPVRIADER